MYLRPINIKHTSQSTLYPNKCTNLDVGHSIGALRLVAHLKSQKVKKQKFVKLVRDDFTLYRFNTSSKIFTVKSSHAPTQYRIK